MKPLIKHHRKTFWGGVGVLGVLMLLSSVLGYHSLSLVSWGTAFLLGGIGIWYRPEWTMIYHHGDLHGQQAIIMVLSSATILLGSALYGLGIPFVNAIPASLGLWITIVGLLQIHHPPVVRNFSPPRWVGGAQTVFGLLLVLFSAM